MESRSEHILTVETKVIDLSQVSSDETWRESSMWISSVSLASLFSAHSASRRCSSVVRCCSWLQFLKVTRGQPWTRSAAGNGISEGVIILLPRLRHSLHLHLHFNSRIVSYNLLLGVSRGSITLTVADRNFRLTFVSGGVFTCRI